MLIRLPVYNSHKFDFCCIRQKTSHRLNREINCHDVIVFLDLNVSRVVLEKHIGIGLIIGSHYFLDIWQCNSQLVDQGIDIKTLNDVA